MGLLISTKIIYTYIHCTCTCTMSFLSLRCYYAKLMGYLKYKSLLQFTEVHQRMLRYNRGIHNHPSCRGIQSILEITGVFTGVREYRGIPEITGVYTECTGVREYRDIPGITGGYLSIEVGVLGREEREGGRGRGRDVHLSKLLHGLLHAPGLPLFLRVRVLHYQWRRRSLGVKGQLYTLQVVWQCVCVFPHSVHC